MSIARTSNAEIPVSIELVGGLDLLGFCLTEGGDGVTLTRPRIGPFAALENWRCTGDGKLKPLDMNAACELQYGGDGLVAVPVNVHDAFTWVCLRVAFAGRVSACGAVPSG